ncbi:MAG: prepilin-type N-terminal cleavage/methylation domain-containing protein [Campylobacterota bacterium]|nr:prepilin-type N-terminal cleavage/methylation domain-containing protein [Campylobacterota bacterium]
MKNLKNRLGFSMLEVIFVIIILGIISSIGSELIAKVYENYIVQRAQHRASIKTQLAINQIANRLSHAILNTLARKEGRGSAPENIDAAMLSASNAYTVLQWVGSDNDSFEAISTDDSRKPGWSAFCDLDASSSTLLSTPGSNLGLANTIIQNLSANTGAKSIGDASIFFPNDSTSHGISSASGETITLDAAASRIVERYKLAWTSYALVVEEGDLNLYYNFSPVGGVNIPDGTPHQLLLKNVTTFKFEGRGETIRIKLCIEERIAEDSTIPSCKEKAIF